VGLLPDGGNEARRREVPAAGAGLQQSVGNIESDLRDAADKLGAKSVGTKWGQLAVNGPSDATPISGFVQQKLEAPPGFEPGMEVLQTAKTDVCVNA